MAIGMGMGAQIFATSFVVILSLAIGLITVRSRFWILYNLFTYMVCGGMLNGFVTCSCMKMFR